MLIEPSDLLDLADELLKRESGKPKQVSLRRAVSNAYYALFHSLSVGSARLFGSDVELQKIVARAVQHRDMKEVCLKVSTLPTPNGTPNRYRAFVQPTPGLEFISSTFVSLQNKRHEADYDHSAHFTRADTGLQVALARQACERWESERQSEVGKRLSLLLLHGNHVVGRL